MILRVVLGGFGQGIYRQMLLQAGVAEIEHHKSAPLLASHTQGAAVRIRQRRAGFDGVVHGVAKNDAKVDGLYKIQQLAVHCNGAGDLCLLASCQLFTQQDVHGLVASGGHLLVRLYFLQDLPDVCLHGCLVAALLQIEQDVFQVVVLASYRVHRCFTQQILLLLLLCGDAQLQHGALLLLGDGVAKKADVYQQRQHTAPGQKHWHSSGQFFIGQWQPIGEPTDKQIGNSGQNIQCKRSAAQGPQLFSRAEAVQQPQQYSLYRCQRQIRQQRRP